MPNIIGEPLRPYVKKQIKVRQKAHGSGVYGNRTPDQLSYLNSKTAWVKLASGISATDERIKAENFRSGLSGATLARNYVLFSGVSRLKGGKLDPRGNTTNKNNIYDFFDGTYNVTGQGTASSGEMGLVPMPGIIDASIKCENRGSIKKATVNIKCYSPEQFKILDMLYLRIGYTMFLEWGWAPYLNNGGGLEHDYSTLIEAEGGFFNEKWKTTPYTEFLKNIESYREGKNGNYDGLLCRVTNFSWTFSQDGTYDIQLNLISLGDVIESLKVNLSPTAELTEVILEAYKLYGDEEIDEKELKENPPSSANNIISAYFFLQRINLTEDDEQYWTKNDCKSTFGENILPVGTKFITPSAEGSKKLKNVNQGDNDFVYFSYANLNDDEDVVNDEGIYVRFGHLLEFIQDNAVFKIKGSNARIIDIDFDKNNNKMYVFPYQVSLDPRVCIVKNTDEPINSKKFYTSLPDWKVVNGNEAYGKIMNIYLNCNMVNRIISEKQDEEGNISLFELLESICSEINKAMGNLNNLDVSVDEDENVIKIIDSSYVPSIKQESDPLELYGYSEDQTQSNFVYDFNIKTEITNDFATMASVGATAGGYVKGTENTMFSKWNKGLNDRFKDKFIPPSKNTSQGEEEEKEPPQIYVEEFWNKRYAPFGATAPQEDTTDLYDQEACSLDAEIIDKNISIVGEFYKYCQYLIQKEKEKYSSPTTGFIPISLGITLEGLSGIKIYNFLEVSTRFLPANYPDSLKFIIKGVNHKIAEGRWETGIETVVIANNFEKDGTQVATYSFIKSVVDKAIGEGKSAARKAKSESEANAPLPPKAQAETSNLAATATSSGTGTSATGVGGKGNKTLGTAGLNAKPEDLSSDALTKETIENIVTESGALGSAIRARIVRIAASYVGQFEALPPKNPGWWDPDYQVKFEKANPHLYGANWYKSAPWCLWFCQVVWREAYNKGNKYTGDWEFAPQFRDQYKAIWDNKLKGGAIITAAHSTARAGFRSINKYITLDDAISGRALPEPGDIALYDYGHGDLVIKPFIKDGKLTGFSAIGGNTGPADANNGGETHYYAKKGDWKSVWGFCKVVTIENENVDYASSPLVGLPKPATPSQDNPKKPTEAELKEASSKAFNTLTYRLVLIYKLKDNYGSGKKPLLEKYKGTVDDDEPKAVEAIKNWFKKSDQQSQLNKLTDNDRQQFNKYLTELYIQTKTDRGEVTFKSYYNNKVKEITIDSDF